MDQPLVRGVLVDQHDPGRGLGQDVGAVQLRAGRAERRLRVGRRRDRRQEGVAGLGRPEGGNAGGKAKRGKAVADGLPPPL